MKNQQKKKQSSIRGEGQLQERCGLLSGRHLGWLCLAVNLVLYVGFALADGPVWCRDSNSYATMDYTREPAYCTFLWLMRKVFGDTILVHGWDLTDRLGGKAAAQEPLYLMAAIVCQAAVMAVTVWYLAKVCNKLGGRRLALAANVVMWGVELLNRFGAKRGSAYFQSIMTEGFGIPFYILFLLFLFQYLRCRLRCAAADAALRNPTSSSNAAERFVRESCRQSENAGRSETSAEEGTSWKKYLLATAGMMTLCTSHHKQLGITLLIFAVCTIGSDLLELIRNKPAQEMARTLNNDSQAAAQAGRFCSKHSLLCWDAAALAGAGVLIFLIGHLYNLGFHGVWSFHTGSADKIDSTLLYTVTEEDAALFDRYGTEELKELFLQIEEQMKEQQLRYVDVMGQDAAAGTADWDLRDTEDAEQANENAAGNNAVSGTVSWVELCSHYADSYDIIGFEVLDPLVDAYVREYQPELTPGSMEFAIATDAVCQEIEHVLVHQNLMRLLHLWVNNMRKGFVNTVLRVSTVLNWASLVLWTAYIALLCRLVLCMRKEKGRTLFNPKMDGTSSEFIRADRTLVAESLGKGRGPVGKSHAQDDIVLLAGLVLIGTTINCMVVGAIIFPQTRYMIYNMGLFYVCLLAMLEKCSGYRGRKN